MSGTASDVVGIISDTRFMKTVSDSSTVTSAKSKELFGIPQAIVRKGSLGKGSLGRDQLTVLTLCCIGAGFDYPG